MHFCIFDSNDETIRQVRKSINKPTNVPLSNLLQFCFICFIFLSQCLVVANAENETWSHYGGSLAGERYVENSSINADTVSSLELAWKYRTGDSTDGSDYDGNESFFKATPILVGDKLIFSTGFNRVIALDPKTGEEHWRFDPQVDFSDDYSEMFTSRGVASWTNEQPSDLTICQVRVFIGTLDARLIALDAQTGELCIDFGRKGTVDLSKGIRKYRKKDYSVTSPPTVIGDLVVVGSSIGDNGAVQLESGVVRAFDVRHGKLVWTWDPIPRDRDAPGIDGWEKRSYLKTGGANVWSIMSADPDRDMIFLPTTSPSPDFYGGERLGDNTHANSVVALKASNGSFLWAYQLVRHDLWDYDLAAQPLLFDHQSEDGSIRPAVAQATKMGFVFVLDRLTGTPLHPVEEVPVPQSDVEGEVNAPTQRFPKLQLHATNIDSFVLWGHSEEHREACERMMTGVRFDGIYTPPSLGGSLLYPGNPGGTNWGSMALNRNQNIGYLTVNRWPTVVRLIPRRNFSKAENIGTLNGREAQFTEQSGTPYGMARFDLNFDYIPCVEGPWSTLVAVDLNLGEILWEVPAGTTPWVDLGDEANDWGYLTTGGPLATSGGVVFLATPYDGKFRAYEGSTGRIQWEYELPADAHATPMSYRVGGSEYVVITAGGDVTTGDGRGDYVISFELTALPRE